jgi:hypothetical protein
MGMKETERYLRGSRTDRVGGAGSGVDGHVQPLTVEQGTVHVAAVGKSSRVDSLGETRPRLAARGKGPSDRGRPAPRRGLYRCFTRCPLESETTTFVRLANAGWTAPRQPATVRTNASVGLVANARSCEM